MRTKRPQKSLMHCSYQQGVHVKRKTPSSGKFYGTQILFFFGSFGYFLGCTLEPWLEHTLSAAQHPYYSCIITGGTYLGSQAKWSTWYLSYFSSDVPRRNALSYHPLHNFLLACSLAASSYTTLVWNTGTSRLNSQLPLCTWYHRPIRNVLRHFHNSDLNVGNIQDFTYITRYAACPCVNGERIFRKSDLP